VFSAAPLDALPRRIDVASSELQVRLVIDQWQVLPAVGRPGTGSTDGGVAGGAGKASP